MSERWRPIEGWPLYEVSDCGRVRSHWFGKTEILKPSESNGYRRVHLYNPDGGGRSEYVHRLVAYAFLGAPPPGKTEVNHKDLTRTNNHVDNLEWVTRQENVDHARANGVFIAPPPRFGEDHHHAKLTDDDVREIRRLYATGEYPQYELAEQFGVAQQTVFAVVSGNGWPHVTGGEPVDVDTSHMWSGENNGKTDLTEQDVVEIRERYAAGGETMQEIADDFGMHKTGVRGILIGRTWKHAGGPIYEPKTYK